MYKDKRSALKENLKKPKIDSEEVKDNTLEDDFVVLNRVDFDEPEYCFVD